MRAIFSAKLIANLVVWVTALSAVPLIAHSAGLGKLSVRSALGQLLNAEIEILSLQPGEIDTLKVQMASGDAYRQAGIEVNPVLASVRLQIDRRDNSAVVKLVSTQQINDPFLDILVELHWASGRLVREYTFLLDPPGYSGRGVIAASPGTPAAARSPPGTAEFRATPLPESSGTTQAVPSVPSGVMAPSEAAGGESPAGAPAPAGVPGSQVAPLSPSTSERQAAGQVPGAGMTPSEERTGQTDAARPVEPETSVDERPLDEQKPAAPPPAERRTPPLPTIREYEVAKGDTLSEIAQRNLPTGVSLSQMMIALYRENPEAFIRRNINLVRSGRILALPEPEAAASIDVREARRIVLSHHGEFEQYRRNLAERAAQGQPLAASGERTSAGRIEARPESPAPASSRDEVRLSKVDPAKPSAAASRAAREDEIVAREREIQEAQSRVGDLEKNVADLRKLLELKNQQLAELEKKAAGKGTESQKPVAVAQAADPKSAVAAPKPQSPPPPPPQAAAPATQPVTPPAPAAKAPETVKAPAEAPKLAPESPKPAAADAAAKLAGVTPPPAPQPPKPAAQTAPKAPESGAKARPRAADTPPPPSVLDEFADSPYALPGAGAVVLMLGAYGFIAWRRRRTAVAKLQDSVMGPASKISPSSVFGPGSQQAPGPSSVVLPSVSQGSVGRVETDEVDAIAEADVYMAYGRDAQAEEILTEAIAKEPNRAALYEKLLEIHANRRDTKAFEQSALKLKGIAGGAGAEWEKAVALGRSIDPANGLYGGSGQVTAAPSADTAFAAPALDVDLDVAPSHGAIPDLVLGGTPQLDEHGGAPASGLDFDLGASAPQETPAADATDFSPGGTLIVDTTGVTGAGGSGLDFDLGAGGSQKADSGGLDFELPAASDAPAAPGAAASAASGGGLEFDMKFDLGEPSADTASAPAAAQPAVDLSAISLDLDAGTPQMDTSSGNGSDDPKWQEVATKLDLAKAYEEMGDKGGASELLNEVLREGDAAQRSQAEELLAKIA